MSTISLTGNDVQIINNRVLTDLADGDCAVLTFPNDIATLKTGKNNNTIYAINQTGRQVELSLRLIRGSADDKFLNNLMAQQNGNFAGFVLLTGEFIKKIGDGEGNIQSDTYILSGGIFKKQIDAKNNVEADTEQSVSIYTLMFANSPRVIS